MVKRIVCLAASRKHSGLCIAGRELSRKKIGAWVRPVSDREKQEISIMESRCNDGTQTAPLQIIEVPVLKAVPEAYQQENWLIDRDSRWKKIGQLTTNDLTDFEDDPSLLWFNGHSSGNGRNDRVPLQEADALEDSLKLLRVEPLCVWVFDTGYNRRQVRALFTYKGVDYNLGITDPAIEGAYKRRSDGTYNLAECFITVSLGEPYKGYAYKLVAAVLKRK
jgi:hypothetical protein